MLFELVSFLFLRGEEKTKSSNRNPDRMTPNMMDYVDPTRRVRKIRPLKIHLSELNMHCIVLVARLTAGRV